MRGARPATTFLVFLALWWLAARYSSVPPFMLPPPGDVAVALWTQRGLLLANTLVTLAEILLGLLCGTLLGGIAALGIVFSPVLQRWLMPVLVVSQAIPVFALAPLMVLWFGFGMVAKIIMAMLVIFFPVTANFADGLRRTPPGWLDLARTMNASPYAMLRHIRLPAALPAFASGLRVATAIAPIGAIIGEWAGASSGLGYIMLNANARIQTALMFAALFILAALTVALYVLVDRLLRRLLYWAPDTTGG
ncbi:ABC transporter permease [Acidocella aquatica]|uniref:ABC transporter permease n=1 Tax=Acidocella aquatica TaxID=1922313 RepID=A0ABQ6A6J6_9PROT|nr:ABC transporter permease [Acidocella aquatica]GLR65720.1 ABC transporter permease [Acidocella aquatica]